jgi:catechol 2,3-dioxygenase-like lactoylglutathione lyase family enzyme
MQITELNHVAIFVSSVDASVRFYRDAIGLPVIPRPDFSFPGAWFRLGERQELHLIGGRLHAPVDEGTRSGHFAMQVKDIAAAAAYLRGKGVAFRGPAPRPDGAQQIFLEDPDGHLVEFCSAPP